MTVALAATAAGCASLTLPTPRITPAHCVIDAELVGTWTDARMTPLGPGWMKVSLNCDCSYTVRVQMLLFRLTERGQYRAADGRILFERESGRTIWPYQVSGERLQLTEHPTEVRTYRRPAPPAECG